MKLLALALSYVVAAIASTYEERARALRARADRAERSALEVRAFTGGILTPAGAEPQEPGDPSDDGAEPPRAEVSYSGTPAAPPEEPLTGSADDD